MDLQHSCLDCKRFVKCKNLDKSFGYVCDKFKIAEAVSIEKFQKQSTAIDPFKFDPTKEQDNDIWSILDDITQNNFMPKNLKIDDSDIPQAPNFFTFTIDPRYLKVTPYAKQIEIGANYFNEICSRCSNKSWMKEGFPVDATYEDIKENVQFFEYGVCPKCGRRKSVRINKGKLRPYVQMAVLVGQRAGKSATFDMMEAYHLHWTLKYPNLISSYGLLPSSQLHRTYTALTIAQVKQSVYDTLYGYLTTSPWFRSYNEMLDYYSTKYGESLYTIKDTFYRYRTVNTMGYVATPDIRALRGNCIPGNVLVNTNRGLIPMKNVKIGDKTLCKKGVRTIINKVKQPLKKMVYRITLQNGMELDATYDHRVLTLNSKGKEEFVQQKDLLGKLVFVQTKSLFPKELKLCYEIKYPTYYKIGKYLEKHGTVKTDELSDICKVSCNSRLSVLYLSPLVNNGMLVRQSPRDSLGHQLPCIYTVTKKFKFDKLHKVFNPNLEYCWKNIKVPSKMTPELARLIGYLLADGWINGDYTINFTNGNMAKIRDFKKCFYKCFGFYPQDRIDGREYVHGELYSVEFSNKPILDFFDYLGVRFALAKSKTIPWSILQAPEECIRNCIDAMVSCDGQIARGSNHTGIIYSTLSKKMAKQLQLLFFSLGYISTLRKHYNEYLVKVSHHSSYLYMKNYTGINKRQYRKDYTINNKTDYTAEKIPHFKGYCCVEANINKNGSFRKYEDCNVLVQKVVKVKKLKKKTVYDVTVDNKDSLFSCSNILVHNTRTSAVIDELGWFMANQSGSVKYDADELHKAILNSFRTVHTATINLYKQGQDNVLNPLFGNISSPSSVNDKIMRLYEQSKTSKYIFGRKYATWEFNPIYTRDSFSDDERNDPVGFMRDYMCIPPSSAYPYISDLQLIKSCFSDTKNAFVLSHRNFDTKAGNKMTTAIISSNWTDSNTPKVLAIDAGRVNNSFALCLGHFDKQQDKPVFDALAEIIPDRTIPINFTHICKDVIYKIIEAYNVKMVVSDRWNSAKLLDDIEAEKGIQVEQYSVKYADFSSFKESLLNDGMLFPKLEKPINQISTLVDGYPQSERGTPMCHFALQLVTVQDDGEKTVEKGGNYTDDIFRATVLAYSYLVDKNYKPLFSGVASKSSVGGAIGSRGGMGISTNSNAISRPTGGYTNNALGSRG